MTWTSGEPALKALWTIDPSITFLNHGSFGAAPRSVLEVQARLREEMERQPVEFLARRLPGLLDAARARLAAFLNAEPEGLAFVPNATSGVNAALGAIHFRPREEIIITDHGYPAVRQAVRYVCDRTLRAVLVEAKVPFPLSRPSEIVEAVERALSPHTRCLLVDHVTSPTALIFPVRELVELAHARNIPIIVDGAHGPGMLPLDLRALGADFYTGNLHKWVCAPKGAAFLYVADEWRDRTHPVTISHGYRKGLRVEFDWTGTDDPTAWLATPAALDALEGLGFDQVRASNHALVQEGRKLVAEALGVELPHPDDPALYGSMAAVPFPTDEPGSFEVTTRLTTELYEKHRIEALFTAFDKRVWLRICGQVYNAPEEYRRLAEALRR